MRFGGGVGAGGGGGGWDSLGGGYSLSALFRRSTLLDARSLALSRVALSLVAIGDVLDRMPDLLNHYTGEGIWPTNYAIESDDDQRYFPIINFMNDHFWFQNALMWATIIAAVFYMIGFHTRKANIALWYLLSSLQFRNYTVLHSGDDFLRLMIFFSIFLPMGRCFSLDSVRKKLAESIHDAAVAADSIVTAKPNSPTQVHATMKRRVHHTDDSIETGELPVAKSINELTTKINISSLATLAIIIQLGIVYFVSVFYKTGGAWHEEASAAGYALQLDYFRTPLADLFSSYLLGLNPDGSTPFTWGLVSFLTRAVLLWELLGAFLYLSPFYPQGCKLFGTLGYVALHVGFGGCMFLGTFAITGVCAQLIMLPSVFWDTVLSWFYNIWTVWSKRSKTQLLSISFDPWHPATRFFAEFSSAFLLFPNIKVIPNIKAAESPSAPSIATTILDKRTGSLVQHEGFVAIYDVLLNSPITYLPAKCIEIVPLMKMVISRCWLYLERTGAKHKLIPGVRCSNCNRWEYGVLRRKQRTTKKSIKWKHVFAAAALTVVILINFKMLDFDLGRRTDNVITKLRSALCLFQYWAMFSPTPPENDFSTAFIARVFDNDNTTSHSYMMLDLEAFLRSYQISNEVRDVFYTFDVNITNENELDFEKKVRDIYDALGTNHPYGWGRTTKIYKNQIKNHRWLKVWESLYDNQYLQHSITQTFCIRWNKRAGKQRYRFEKQHGKKITEDETEEELETWYLNEIRKENPKLQKSAATNSTDSELISFFKTRSVLELKVYFIAESISPFNPAAKGKPIPSLIYEMKCGNSEP